LPDPDRIPSHADHSKDLDAVVDHSIDRHARESVDQGAPVGVEHDRARLREEHDPVDLVFEPGTKPRRQRRIPFAVVANDRIQIVLDPGMKKEAAGGHAQREPSRASSSLQVRLRQDADAAVRRGGRVAVH
jgi:hypothetical protein